MIVNALKSKRLFLNLAGVLVVTLCVCGALVGCAVPSADQSAGEANRQSAQQTTISVQVQVDSSAAEGRVTEDRQVDIAQGATALEALAASSISYNAQNGPYGVYVTNLGGLAEKDFGPTSGWTFTINGEYAQGAIDTCVLNQGDVLNMVYYAEKDGQAAA